MRWLALCVLAACDQSHTEMYPVYPGGGGGGAIGSGSSADAAIDSGDANTSDITGRVCVVSDARAPTTCGANVAGLTVTLGTSTAMTGADGTFTIARPTGTNLVWRVSGATIEPSAMQFSAETTIPAMSTAIYTDMVTTTTATEEGGDGAIIAQFKKAGVPVAGATVTAVPTPVEIYYDDAMIALWGSTATGNLGVAWIPSIDPTAGAELRLQSGATMNTFTGIPVFAETITFAFLVVP